MIVDTHAHLWMCDAEPDTLIQAAAQAGVTHVVCVALDADTAQICLSLSQQFSGVHPTVGIYPGEPFDETLLRRIHDLAQTRQFCAIGEIGLDYYWMKQSPDYQKKAFIAQLELARELQMPVVIHNRESEADMLSILKQFPDVKKVLHCYSSGYDFAQELVHENTYFSFTGSITYSKKGKTVDAIRRLPLDCMMIETDSPYLTPKMYQGQKNQPAYVSAVLEKIVELRSESFEEIQDVLFKNSVRFFDLV